MGKRKERRLAAMSAANRRVKLDLFAEPPGEEMVKSNNEEIGGNQEQDHSASVPTSPSSSGQNKENPLLLLGQYSDDELDDDASKQQKDKDADDGNNLMEPDDKEREHADANENLGSNKDEAIEVDTFRLESDKANSPIELKASAVESNENTSVDAKHCENELANHTYVSGLSDSQANGHVIGHWKLVLHEESNQYYYWNRVTGETSWVVPEALAVDTQTTDEHSFSTAAIEGVGNAVEANSFSNANIDTTIYSQLSADGHESSNLISKDTEGYANMELKSEKVYDSSQRVGQYSVDNVTASYGNLSGYSNLLEHLSITSSLQNSLNNEEKNVHVSKGSDHFASEDTHASQLVKYGEALLQRLSMLNRSAPQPEGYESIKKEIDIRISDCRALSSYGLSLLPFWWHTDVQLKQIESAINKSEASTLVIPKEFNDLTSKQKDPQSGTYSEITEKDDKIIVNSESGSDMTKNENASTERTSLKTDFDVQGIEHQPAIALEEDPISNPSTSAPTLIYNTEDDMDVEMEVDETPPTPPSGHLFQTNLPSSQYTSLPSDEFNVPPPPEEEWIPPPPPEVEPFPPPPPPESELNPPPESELNPPEETSTSFPPSYTDTISYPFPDHYSVGYHIPAYDYYSSTVNEVSNASYYGITGGSQLIESEPPAYYEPIASSSLTNEALSCMPVVPAAYFDVANTSISSEPVFSNTESSAFYVESSAVNYKDMTPVIGHSSVVDLPLDSLGKCIPKISKDSQMGTAKALSSLSTVQTVGASSGNGSNLDTQPPAAPNNQPKVRSKKHKVVTTLRSNKKVSILVDKWKAAKEELHGNEEEEEPENTLEILEKKRQKEIEAWCARQVATGEAQDNANFVPLGGDWRERVKRKKTDEASIEDSRTSSAAVVKDKKQPDLVELSNGLPSGWQAYWDDSTKQVYYGNHTTSETTWSRPAS